MLKPWGHPGIRLATKSCALRGRYVALPYLPLGATTGSPSSATPTRGGATLSTGAKRRSSHGITLSSSATGTRPEGNRGRALGTDPVTAYFFDRINRKTPPATRSPVDQGKQPPTPRQVRPPERRLVEQPPVAPPRPRRSGVLSSRIGTLWYLQSSVTSVPKSRLGTHPIEAGLFFCGSPPRILRRFPS